MYRENGVTANEQLFFEQLAKGANPLEAAFWEGISSEAEKGFAGFAETIKSTQLKIDQSMSLLGLAGFAKYDASIVRGLAYYTGFVWEISDTRAARTAAPSPAAVDTTN